MVRLDLFQNDAGPLHDQVFINGLTHVDDYEHTMALLEVLLGSPFVFDEGSWGDNDIECYWAQMLVVGFYG